MRQHSNLVKDTAEKVVKDIRRGTRKHTRLLNELASAHRRSQPAYR